jgi:glycosyltransferase involved in cell wall biosynthesis
MRIAYLCADFGIPIRGHKGASVHVREIVGALVAQGHEVCVLSPNPDGENQLAAPPHYMTADGFPAISERLVRAATRRRATRLPRETRELAYNLTLYRQAWRYLRSWQPDLLYERYSLFNLAGLGLARRLGVPHILEVNAPLRQERVRTTGLALDPPARRVERTLFDRSDALLVVSGALRRYVLAHGGHSERTIVLPNGVDTVRFHPGVDGRRARARHGLEMDSLVIGFAGSLKSWHGVEVLLEAFALLHAGEPAARLLIVGAGPYEAAARRRAGMLGLGAAAIFTGNVAHQEMPELLAAMDIGAAPYLEVPDFYFSPLKVYEYMAAGLAVVASDAGEIAALVRGGQTGLLCPPGDAGAMARVLLDLARTPALRARLGAAARAEAERHTWAANAATIVKHGNSLRAARFGSLAYRSLSARGRP